MQYIFIISKFVFNFFIILLLVSIFIKYKTINIDRIRQKKILDIRSKISSSLYINEQNRFLITKLIFSILLKNIILLFIIKNSIYINLYVAIWSTYDLLSFLVYILIYQFTVLIISSELNSFYEYNNNKLLNFFIFHINKINPFLLRILLKIIFIFVLITLCFFIINFIPHLIY